MAKKILSATEQAAKKATKQMKRVEFWDKVYGATGKAMTNEWRDANLMTGGMLDIGKKVAGAGKGLFKAVDYSDAKSIADYIDTPLPIKMKGKAQLAIAGGILAYGAVDGAFQVHNKKQLGEVSGGEMANMINGQGALSNVDDKEREARLTEMGKKDLGNINTYGAEADLVFALHNMR